MALACLWPELAAAGDQYEIYYRHWLRNRTDETLKDVRVWMPTPQDSEYQKILEFQVELWDQPFHVEQTADEFEQPIVRVTIEELKPHAEVEIGYSCLAVLNRPPRIKLDPARSGAREDIPPELHKLYTADLPGTYDLDAPEIRRLAAELLAAYPNLVGRAIAIHDYVASQIRYERGAGWDAAPVVLRRGSGSCSEFTFLFSALCRASGLPTRMVGSSVCREKRLPYEDTVWHRWTEVFLPPHGWVPFDATQDRGTPPKQECVGSFRPGVLVVSRRGGGKPFGKAYIGANNHSAKLESKRSFTWTRGAKDAFEQATAEHRRGNHAAAVQALRATVARHSGSRWAKAAERRLEELVRPNH